MDKVDADNFMDKVHADSFVKSNGKVETDGFDSIKLGFEDDTVDADSFVDSIELEFEDDPPRYKEFIRIMKAYKKSRYIHTLLIALSLMVFSPDSVIARS